MVPIVEMGGYSVGINVFVPLNSTSVETPALRLSNNAKENPVLLEELPVGPNTVFLKIKETLILLQISGSARGNVTRFLNLVMVNVKRAITFAITLKL